MKKSPLLLSLILLTGCAGTGPAFDASQTPHSSSKAELVIYRPSSFIGSGWSPATFVNGVEKCDIINGSFYYAAVPAGSTKVEYSVLEHSERSGYSFSAQAGHKYYIRISPEKAKMLGGATFGLAGSLAASGVSDNKGSYSIALEDESQALDEMQSIKQTMSCK